MTLRPCSAPSRKSSSPNAIAVCTMPVPSSAETKSRGQDGVALLAVLRRRDERERRLVARADHVRAREAVGDHRVRRRARGRPAPRPARSPRSSARRSARGRRRPRRWRPASTASWSRRAAMSPSRSAPAGLVTGYSHVDARVLDVLVALRDLVRRQRRAVARAVRDDLEALVEQVLVPQLLERPPDGLDVRACRACGTDRRGRPSSRSARSAASSPRGNSKTRLAALRVELRDPVFLDLLLGLDPELRSGRRSRPAGRGSPSRPCGSE